MVHDSETFAALIESKLIEFGITQLELERRSAITDTTWAGWRAGRLPSRSLLMAIAAALQVPLDELKALVERERAGRLRIVGTVINTAEAAKAWSTDHGAKHVPAVDA